MYLHRQKFLICLMNINLTQTPKYSVSFFLPVCFPLSHILRWCLWYSVGLFLVLLITTINTNLDIHTQRLLVREVGGPRTNTTSTITNRNTEWRTINITNCTTPIPILHQRLWCTMTIILNTPRMPVYAQIYFLGW